MRERERERETERERERERIFQIKHKNLHSRVLFHSVDEMSTLIP